MQTSSVRLQYKVASRANSCTTDPSKAVPRLRFLSVKNIVVKMQFFGVGGGVKSVSSIFKMQNNTYFFYIKDFSISPNLDTGYERISQTAPTEKFHGRCRQRKSKNNKNENLTLTESPTQ